MFKDDLAKEMNKNLMKATELARYLGCAESTVSSWIHGKTLPTARYMRPICDLFELDSETYAEEYQSAKDRKVNAGKKDYQINRTSSRFDGEKLVQLRKKKALTQGGLSKALGWSQKAISTWELGRKPIDAAMEDICEFFNVEPSYFNPNIVEPFTPKVKADPKVIEREKNWKNPYMKQAKGAFEAIDMAPVVNTEIVEPKEEPAHCFTDVKQLKADYEVLSQRLETIARRMETLEFQGELRVKRFEETDKDIEALRRLIIKFLLKENPDAQGAAITDTADCIIIPKEKKSFWQRLWE